MSEERYIEWLERLEYDIEDTIDIDRFQEFLETQFLVTPERLTALWDAIEFKHETLAEGGTQSSSNTRRLLRKEYGRCWYITGGAMTCASELKANPAYGAGKAYRNS